MDKQTATMAIQFLQRTDLKGAEVPAYMAVVAALGEIVSTPEPLPTIEAEATP